MWSKARDDDAAMPPAANPARARLLVARNRMIEALRMLDEDSLSAAAASLDMAIHQLDRELSRG